MANTDRWPHRYHQLLACSGVTRSSLRAQLVTPARPHGDGQCPDRASVPLSLADCITHPDYLADRLRASADLPLSASELRIRASVLQQNLALTVIAPLVCELLLDGTATCPDPTNIWLDTHSASGLSWYQKDSGSRLTPAQFIAAAASQVKVWYPLFRQALGVSPGAYWSSVGLAFCAPFSALYDKAPARRLCDEATAWLASFDCDAECFIDWIPAELDRQTCAIPQRRGCCLKYRLPGGVCCGTCGLYRKERMAMVRPERRGNAIPECWSPAE